MESVGCTNPADTVLQLVDQGVLYVDNLSSTVSLTILEDGLLFAPNEEKSSFEDYTRFAASLLMVYGGIGNNAGKPLEQFIRSRLKALNPKFNYCGRSLKIIDERIHIINSSETVALSPAVLCNGSELFVWENEVGLDGICIEFTPKEKVVVVHGWQCKGGSIFAEIGGGKIETCRKAYIRECKVDKVVDTRINGIIVKAEVGFLSILNCLCVQFLQFKVSLGDLIITTTKPVKTTEANSKNSISKSMISKFGKIPNNLKFTYNVCVHDGDIWFRKVRVSDNDFLKLLPPQATPGRGTYGIKSCAIS